MLKQITKKSTKIKNNNENRAKSKANDNDFTNCEKFGSSTTLTQCLGEETAIPGLMKDLGIIWVSKSTL